MSCKHITSFLVILYWECFKHFLIVISNKRGLFKFKKKKKYHLDSWQGWAQYSFHCSLWIICIIKLHIRKAPPMWTDFNRVHFWTLFPHEKYGLSELRDLSVWDKRESGIFGSAVSSSSFWSAPSLLPHNIGSDAVGGTWGFPTVSLTWWVGPRLRRGNWARSFGYTSKSCSPRFY